MKRFTNQSTGLLFYLILQISLISCTQELKFTPPSSVINISTRSDNSDIYPVYIYIMKKEGNCVKHLSAIDANDPLKADLPTGDYDIYAFSKAEEDIWTFPTQNEATSQTIISPRQANLLNDLGFGHSEISIDEEKEECIIKLSHLLCQINLSISNIPNNISDVSVSIKPLSKAITLNGKYKETEEITIPLQKNTDNNWEKLNTFAIPGTASQSTFTITMKDQNGKTTSYSLIAESPKPNQKYRFNGKYKPEEGISDTRSFTFSLSMQPWDTYTQNKDFGPSTSNAKPQVGYVWNNCLVLNTSNKTDNEMDLLLMTTIEWTGLSIEDAISTLSSYQEGNIANWRLPNQEDIKAMSEIRNDVGISTLNDRLVECGGSSISGNAYYLGTEADKSYIKFHFNGNTYETGTTSTFRVRGITTYHYTW